MPNALKYAPFDAEHPPDEVENICFAFVVWAILFCYLSMWICSTYSGKLPKNYNSEVDPDPERWIPKRERTYYKGKRQKKGAAVGGYQSCD